jgi:hypothetical protein
MSCKVVYGYLRPRHAFHDGHDFKCPGDAGRIAHGFPHFAEGGFWISARHWHKSILAIQAVGGVRHRGLIAGKVPVIDWSPKKPGVSVMRGVACMAVTSLPRKSS